MSLKVQRQALIQSCARFPKMRRAPAGARITSLSYARSFDVATLAGGCGILVVETSTDTTTLVAAGKLPIIRICPSVLIRHLAAHTEDVIWLSFKNGDLHLRSAGAFRTSIAALPL